jgi:hypothetical protein
MGRNSPRIASSGFEEPGLGAGTRLFRFGALSDALRGVLLFFGHLKLLDGRFEDRRQGRHTTDQLGGSFRCSDRGSVNPECGGGRRLMPCRGCWSAATMGARRAGAQCTSRWCVWAMGAARRNPVFPPHRVASSCRQSTTAESVAASSMSTTYSPAVTSQALRQFADAGRTTLPGPVVAGLAQLTHLSPRRRPGRSRRHPPVSAGQHHLSW